MVPEKYVFKWIANEFWVLEITEILGYFIQLAVQVQII